MAIVKRIIIIGILILATLPGVARESRSDSISGARHTEFLKKPDYTLSVRANLLRWATLTPDVGIEWRINRDYAIAVNGCWTTWSWDNNDRRYALREIAPEVRRYLGCDRRAYVGAMYKAGAFNYKLSTTGKQGNINGCGITGGYCLPLNARLTLDFSLAIGYLHARYEKYNVTDGVRVRAGNGRKNWFGPVNAGVTLTWSIF